MPRSNQLAHNPDRPDFIEPLGQPIRTWNMGDITVEERTTGCYYVRELAYLSRFSNATEMLAYLEPICRPLAITIERSLYDMPRQDELDFSVGHTMDFNDVAIDRAIDQILNQVRPAAKQTKPVPADPNRNDW